jgi:hypothetical protein
VAIAKTAHPAIELSQTTMELGFFYFDTHDS